MAMTTRSGYGVREGLIIPAREVWFEYSHALGPGGQNINKVATRTTLCFCPAGSGVLSDVEKRLALSRLANRINADGVLRVTSGDGRSQAANRILAGTRFRALMAEAISPRKVRRQSTPGRAARERRLADKRLNAVRKAGRRKDGLDDGRGAV